MDTINFDKLVGSKASLFLTNGVNQFQLGSVIFEVIEDEDDGYRSSMEEVRVITREAKKDIFLAEIVVCSESDGTYSLREANGSLNWLNFGTDRTDDYYPSFIFSWNPKRTTEDELIDLIK